MTDAYDGRIKRMINRLNNVKNHISRNEKPYEISSKKKISQTEVKNNLVIEKEKKLEILEKTDVLVVGGGPSGISAAIASSRAGANTMIIDKFGCLGGVITTVGMETIGWYRYEGTIDCEGIGIEMERLAENMGASRKWAYNDSQCLDAEYFKIIADKLIEENNVKCLLHTLVVDVIVQENIIKGVIIETKLGRNAILAKRVIDCTGDADVAYLSGAQFRQNKLEDKMGVTTVFNCSGVDTEKFKKYTEDQKKTYKDWGQSWCQNTSEENSKLPTPFLGEEFKNASEKNIIPKSSSNISGSWSSLTNAGEATNLNLVHMKNIDCTNVYDLTKAEIEGRKETLNALQGLKTMVPGFENARLRNFGMTLGTRDSRKIMAEYNLTKNDVLGEARFKDSIGIFPEFLDGYNVLTLPTSGRYFHVPLRCMIPLKIENLLVAGRCVAGDNYSHAAMRNMMACTVTGQGAGVAAAISLTDNCKVRNVNIDNVHTELRKQKVRID